MNNRGIVELVEAFKRKFNPSETQEGRRAANREIGAAVRVALKEGKLNPESVSFKSLWEQIVGPIGSRGEMFLVENLTSSAFPNISGEIISKVMIDAYDAFPKDADKLVRTVPSRLKVSRVAGWTALGTVERVNEKQAYPELSPPDEKIQTIKNFKYGGLLSLTKEDIFFDQTGELVDRARQIGEEGARYRQELIFTAVCDVNTDALSGAELYSVGNSNLQTGNPLGTTGWETVDNALLAKRDEKNKPIWVKGDRPMMVVPTGLDKTALKLQMNEYGDMGTANLDVNLARNKFDVVLNPYLTNASTTWWYGAFKRQFRWEEVWPLEVFMRVGQDTEEGFKSDVIQQHKCSFYGGAGATDTRYVIENQA